MKIPNDEVTTDEVKEWQGLHLLHFQASSCSQKVRILLREKGLDWQSHPIDLVREQHVTPWFLGINPRGVVPVLVHDGVVHVESNDILEYLDQLDSTAEPYFPRSDEEIRIARESLALEDGLHADLRTITMGFLTPRAAAKKSPKTLEAYERDGAPNAQRDKEVAWWRAFAERGITPDDARASAAAFDEAFTALDERLAEQPWLLGSRISVLEISWFTSMHRLVTAGYPISRHSRLSEHYARLLARPAFAAEVANRGLPGVALRAYGAWRRFRGSTLGDVLETPA
ncbi:MAG: glutathione S-transferase family protein [Acidobacteriota bacterium]